VRHNNEIIISQEDFNSLAVYWADPGINLRWDLVFTLPAWLKVWWYNFGSGAELYLRAVRQRGKIIGIAPLQIRDGQASIIGSTNVCDYQDFVIAPGMESDFFDAVISDLCQQGIKSLDLEPLRPDSAVSTHLIPLAQQRHYQINYHQVDVSLDIELPQSWDEYLKMLDRKQRHELRRKLRNLQEMGDINYRVVEDKSAIAEAMNVFLELFPEARQDKAEFMTPPMQAFFVSLTEALAEIGVMKLGILEHGKKPIAMVMYFDYNGNIYLYNSAYDPDYRSLSAGLISKVRCIQDGIQKGKGKFDFLKGNEKYKYSLRGKEIPLYSCQITIQQDMKFHLADNK